MVYFSPQIDGNKQQVPEARTEWKVYVDLAKRVKPEQSHLIDFNDAQSIRDEIALANRDYDGIQYLKNRGDVFQWGGAWLCEGGICPTVDGKGNLIPVDIPKLTKPDGTFYLTTRRGKQFNSMVYKETDPFNDAGRNDVLLNESDAKELNIRNGEPVVVYNQHGTFQGKAHVAEIAAGNVGLYFPEGNFLIPKGIYDGPSGIPQYSVAVKVEKAERFHARKDVGYLEKRVEDLETEMS